MKHTCSEQTLRNKNCGIFFMLSENSACFPPHLLQFSQCWTGNGSSPDVVQLTTDPVSPFQRRSSSASSFHAFLLQVISDVMSLALCLQAMSKAPQHFRSPRHKISVNATLFSSIAIAYRYPHPNWFFLPAEPSVYMTTSYVLLFSEFLYEKLICGFILFGHTLNNCKEHKSLRLM